MDNVLRSRVAPLVTAALGEESLDPAVRDLAVERLEGHLLAAVRALPFAASTARVTLSVARGTVSLTPAPALNVGEAAALRERVDRTILAQLSPTVGAARLAVRSGERASAPRDRARVEPPPRRLLPAGRTSSRRSSGSWRGSRSSSRPSRGASTRPRLTAESPRSSSASRR